MPSESDFTSKQDERHSSFTNQPFLLIKPLETLFDTEALRKAREYNQEFQSRLNKSKETIDFLIKQA